MNILICHNEYAALSGEEHAISEITALMNKNGHTVQNFFRTSSGIRSIRDKYKAFFCGIHSSDAVKSLKQQLAAQRPDIAFVQNLYPFLSPSILTLLHNEGIPVVMRCPNYRLFCPNGLFLCHDVICERCARGHEYWAIFYNCENDRLKSIGYAARNAIARITRRILDNVDYFIVLSEFQRRKFIAYGLSEERMVVLHNVLPDIQYALNEVQRHEIGSWVTFVGRISPEKGIEDFIAAAKFLPDIPFAVIGNYDKMLSLVRQSPSNVKWMGFLNGAALNNAYMRSRILVMPTRCFEGFPNVITHAMFSCIPVIASRIGAIPEIVEEDVTGFLYEPQCIEELVSQIRFLYGDITRCKQMGFAGHSKASRYYNREVVGRRLEEILQRSITKAKHRILE